jgi:hypothetical protein
LADVERTIHTLEADIKQWIRLASGLKAAKENLRDTENRVQVFRNKLYGSLKAFGHGALHHATEKSLTFDDEYTPYLDNRRLRSIGSSSDQARLIAAYSVGLALASEQLNGLHPGFVLMDEPLQQNPDDRHRELFLQFLKNGLAPDVRTQVIVFTYLQKKELEIASRGKAHIQAFNDDHFLKLVSASPDGEPSLRTSSDVDTSKPSI